MLSKINTHDLSGLAMHEINCGGRGRDQLFWVIFIVASLRLEVYQIMYADKDKKRKEAWTWALLML